MGNNPTTHGESHDPLLQQAYKLARDSEELTLKTLGKTIGLVSDYVAEIISKPDDYVMKEFRGMHEVVLRGVARAAYIRGYIDASRASQTGDTDRHDHQSTLPVDGMPPVKIADEQQGDL